MRKKLKVLVLMHEDLVPPADISGLSEKQVADFRTEYDVIQGLEELGHEVHRLGVGSDLGPIRRAFAELSPDIAFNLLVHFHGVAVYDQHVVSYLELLRKRYTGCNPTGLLLARDKAISKQLLAFHRIRVPRFAVFPLGRKARRPRKLSYPLVVKSLYEEASLGISQASLVTSDEKLEERVAFMHETFGVDVIAEEYIDGRELYVGVVGNRRLHAFPVWEMMMDQLPDKAPRIATRKVKWDLAYQKKYHIDTAAAELPPGMSEQILKISTNIYRVLKMSGYARIDFRLAPDGKVYVLEANPNPDLQRAEDFAQSAKAGGVEYPVLIQRIVNLGLSYQVEWDTADA
ncbi:MAG: Ddl-like protein [Polyangiaceae bacterium]|jgi:D-alanine-D-alanine ligase|nr:Ddl-like protein [Polyangiaceae bacterium]